MLQGSKAERTLKSKRLWGTCGLLSGWMAFALAVTPAAAGSDEAGRAAA
jgi:hypothetical protein